MATATTTSKPFSHELVALTDEQLTHHLDQHGRIVSVHDPENLPSTFIQRLRDCAHGLSYAVDLDQVAARLENVPANQEWRPLDREPSPATTAASPSAEDEYREILRHETEAYYSLIDSGGCSPYPLPLLQEFVTNPEPYLQCEQYRDIILFWRQRTGNASERTAFCSYHLLRWERFRRLQRIARERRVNSVRSLVQSAEWDSWEAFVEAHGPRDGQWGFEEYARRTKARLNKHGFSQAFQLQQDLENQDRLTTWIEYLAYEYWFFDRAVRFVSRFSSQHDDMWQNLVDSGVLRPGETYDIICDIDSAFQRASERENAEKQVQLAMDAVSGTRAAIDRSHGSATTLRQRLLTEQVRLDAATGEHESIMARNNRITTFLQRIRRYRCKKDEGARHNLLLRWILRQIPTIELELDLSISSEVSPESRRCIDRASKSSHAGRNQSLASLQPTQPAPTSPIKPRKRRRSLTVDEPIPKRLRTSDPEETGPPPAGAPLRKSEARRCTHTHVSTPVYAQGSSTLSRRQPRHGKLSTIDFSNNTALEVTSVDMAAPPPTATTAQTSEE